MEGRAEHPRNALLFLLLIAGDPGLTVFSRRYDGLRPKGIHRSERIA
jgi:hypothetical protein